MRINPFVYGIIVLGAFFGVILGFQSAGVWSISGKVTSSGEMVQPSAADVDTIKGWMTLEQVTATFNVPLAELLQQFDLPADTPPATALKDLETELFSVTNLRDWLLTRQSALQEQPVEAAPAAEESAPAVEAESPATPKPTSPASDQPTPTFAEATATVHIAPDKTVTGKTTFQELLDWGVPQEAIQKVIGGELPAPSVVIKDYVTGQGMDFATQKSALQAEVDRIK